MATKRSSALFPWVIGISLIVVAVGVMLFAGTTSLRAVSPTFSNTLGIQQYLERAEKFTFCEFQSFGKIPTTSCK